MKKRTLLVSTAILLVAIMALATASFAWFTAGTTATAKALSITTTAGTSLQIMGNRDTNFSDTGTSWFATSGDANSPVSLAPATSFDGKTFAKLGSTAKVPSESFATATHSDGTALLGSDLDTIASGDIAGYVASTTFTLKNTSTSAVNVRVASLTIDGAYDIKNSLRVAITVGANTYVYSLADPATTVGKYNGTSWELDDMVYTQKGAAGVGANIITGLTSASNQAITVAVWIEGQDANCTTTKAVTLGGNDLSINIGFAAAPAA